jgi:hypothetical protein
MVAGACGRGYSSLLDEKKEERERNRLVTPSKT